jgi:hypothetical protein
MSMFGLADASATSYAPPPIDPYERLREIVIGGEGG